MNIAVGSDESHDLITAMSDRERRHRLAAIFIRTGLAEQIREMRDAKGWTQEQLGLASGKRQETISQLEDPDYGNYTIKTLKRLAEAFDVALFVRFGSFGELAERLLSLSPDDLAVPDFEQDPILHLETGAAPPGEEVLARHTNVVRARARLDRTAASRDVHLRVIGNSLSLEAHREKDSTLGHRVAR